jgi:hypothetical protein
MALINPHITSTEMLKKHLPFTNQYLVESLQRLFVSKTSQAPNSPLRKRRE